ncbi:MAG TPA: nuclear transport factor 2 family protein [Sphingorhabdus sp.]|jgi:ketosteroid isomerase-like protein|nr:nuclear transport factor 2 family protein [Sphingorhabdus sp.]
MRSLRFAIALVAAPASAQASTPEATAASFLDAFKSMDEARFDGFFAPEVSMFFPDDRFPKGRVEGRDAVLAAFHSFFKRVKETGRNSLNIVPLEQSVQRYGDVAIVTFRLDSDERIGRRSIVFRKIAGDWRIAHFHASAIEK